MNFDSINIRGMIDPNEKTGAQLMIACVNVMGGQIIPYDINEL